MVVRQRPALLNGVQSVRATKILLRFDHLFPPCEAADKLAEEMGIEEDVAPGVSPQGAISSCWGAIPAELLAQPSP